MTTMKIRVLRGEKRKRTLFAASVEHSFLESIEHSGRFHQTQKERYSRLRLNRNEISAKRFYLYRTFLLVKAFSRSSQILFGFEHARSKIIRKTRRVFGRKRKNNERSFREKERKNTVSEIST